ncbi:MULTISPECIES: nuclear transport factor 2 family protein [unclassified Nocardia]|uniref:nuclear transport factor 2 family protein n=1 Tax=unclassified Nocardia TaxID=2637762 RepID=UPI001CE4420B|nr:MULTISPECIES: nuclear transport factor 2 family protein [unclassified Nocardia]
MSDLDIVKAFYTTIQSHDGTSVSDLLHPELEVRAAPGLPLGLGGAYAGPHDALTRLWGVVHQNFDMAPYDETCQRTTDGTVVVTGHYRGTARETGREFEAEFAHLWQVRDGKLFRLHQYVDTAVLNAALD